ncbi:MAG: hypothetical protein KF770_21940 [Anaerolineae bacterium]|nr:hypothetical protein [Anaerolineae bacterium]
MAEINALVPVEQREVEFYGDELTAVRLDNGQIYASISQMCRALGLDTQAQRRRIERHTVLTRGLGVANLATPGLKIRRSHEMAQRLAPTPDQPGQPLLIGFL